jgi:endonuclease/exonuclease/phosphatase family metal-dependent hydrolase
MGIEHLTGACRSDADRPIWAMLAAVTDTDSAYGPLIDTRLRVLTWNLWHRFGPWEARRPAIAATLARLDADVVCLQEVWADTEVEFAAELADGLGFHQVYGSRLDFEGVRFGNAILSRWPITGSDVLALPSRADTEELRTCVRADVAGPRGALQVFSTHLNWRFDQSGVRQDQVRSICTFVDSSKPEGGRAYPPILCGDFNADPDSDEIRMLTGRSDPPVRKLVFHDAWEVAGEASASSATGATWSNANPYAKRDLEPDRRIDYVFVGWPKAGGAGHVTTCTVEGLEPVDGVVPSDHLALLAELRY